MPRGQTVRTGTSAALVTGAGKRHRPRDRRRLEADGWQVHAVDVADGDLTTREGNRAVVDGALERFGRLDAVVANAGFQHVSPIADFDEDRWDALLAVLLTSPFLLAKYAWEALAAGGRRPLPRRRVGARTRRLAVQGGLCRPPSTACSGS